MYKLHMPICYEDKKEYPIVQKLFKEVLGYTEQEISQFTKNKFMCDVVVNITLEQAQQLCEIFYSNEIQIYLFDQQTNKPLFWQPDLGITIPRHTPKEHYCDEPLISREHLVDPNIQKEIERQRNLQQMQNNINTTQNKNSNTPSITCPYCKSTNTKKITNTSKAIHTAFFGIFSLSRNSKQWHCNGCGSDF